MKKGHNSSSKKKSQNKKQSSATRQRLIDFLVKSAEVERKLQIIKEMLSQQQQFTPASLFYRLDTARKGFINERDIQNFLKSSRIDFKGSDIKLLFGKINENKRQQIVRQREFQNFILPKQNPRLRYYTVRRPVLIPIPNEPLTQKIEWITSKLFSQIVIQANKLLQFHQTLLSSFDFDANNIFSELSSNKQYITAEDIQKFFSDTDVQISQEEIGCLLSIIDRRGEGHLYQDDFKYYFATLGLKKEHQIFDELSPIPALKDFQENEIKKALKDRDQTLKDRYKDNKSYVKGMDEEGHHILGYSKRTDSKSPAWLTNSRKSKK